VADTYLSKLQRLQNKVLRTIGKFSTCTPVRNLHTAFNLLCLYDYITNCAGNKQESYKIMSINVFVAWHKKKPDVENIIGLDLAVVMLMTFQVTDVSTTT
jgi:hypothetical protein